MGASSPIGEETSTDFPLGEETGLQVLLKGRRLEHKFPLGEETGAQVLPKGRRLKHLQIIPHAVKVIL